MKTPSVSDGQSASRSPAFTLVELLVVIAIIAILASLVVSAVSNATSDAANVIARQQQAVVQEALNNWIAAYATGETSVADARTVYSGASTDFDKLTLISPYLDDSTFEHLSNNSPGNNQLQTEAMEKAGTQLTFSAWSAAGTYPKVTLGSSGGGS